MNATFAGSRSMRENYNTQGVDEYYANTGQEYRNPHFGSMLTAMGSILNLWLPMLCEEYGLPGSSGEAGETGHEEEGPSVAAEKSVKVGRINMLDLACGAGEATQAIYMWEKVLNGYQAAPQHQKSRKDVGPDSKAVAELLNRALVVDACDPYTQAAYHQWTGQQAESFSFQDVADGCLLDRAYHVCACSYALHVLEGSKLFATLMSLSLVCGYLIVLSPHKKPSINAACGWEMKEHIVIERVHAWIYESMNLQKREELCEFLFQEQGVAEQHSLASSGPTDSEQTPSGVTTLGGSGEAQQKSGPTDSEQTPGDVTTVGGSGEAQQTSGPTDSEQTPGDVTTVGGSGEAQQTSGPTDSEQTPGDVTTVGGPGGAQQTSGAGGVQATEEGEDQTTSSAQNDAGQNSGLDETGNDRMAIPIFETQCYYQHRIAEPAGAGGTQVVSGVCQIRELRSSEFGRFTLASCVRRCNAVTGYAVVKFFAPRLEDPTGTLFTHDRFADDLGLVSLLDLGCRLEIETVPSKRTIKPKSASTAFTCGSRPPHKWTAPEMEDEFEARGLFIVDNRDARLALLKACVVSDLLCQPIKLPGNADKPLKESASVELFARSAPSTTLLGNQPDGLRVFPGYGTAQAILETDTEAAGLGFGDELDEKCYHLSCPAMMRGGHAAEGQASLHSQVDCDPVEKCQALSAHFSIHAGSRTSGSRTSPKQMKADSSHVQATPERKSSMLHHPSPFHSAAHAVRFLDAAQPAATVRTPRLSSNEGALVPTLHRRATVDFPPTAKQWHHDEDVPVVKVKTHQPSASSSSVNKRQPDGPKGAMTALETLLLMTRSSWSGGTPGNDKCRTSVDRSSFMERTSARSRVSGAGTVGENAVDLGGRSSTISKRPTTSWASTAGENAVDLGGRSSTISKRPTTSWAGTAGENAVEQREQVGTSEGPKTSRACGGDNGLEQGHASTSTDTHLPLCSSFALVFDFDAMPHGSGEDRSSACSVSSSKHFNARHRSTKPPMDGLSSRCSADLNSARVPPTPPLPNGLPKRPTAAALTRAYPPRTSVSGYEQSGSHAASTVQDVLGSRTPRYLKSTKASSRDRRISLD
eukprot:gene22125-29186_t